MQEFGEREITALKEVDSREWPAAAGNLYIPRFANDRCLLL